MADNLEKATRAISNWHIGQTSERYESSGRGAATISTGKGDRGGVSYGAYQLSSKMGTLQEYLGQSHYGENFKGLTPGTTAFNARWLDLAKTDPGFAKDQQEFIGRTHYSEQREKLNAQGIDLSGRGRAVQDALWSTSVQFRNLTPTIVAKGLEETFGKGYKLSALTDKDIVSAIQDYKISHNNALFKSSPEWWPGLLKRAESEKSALLQLAEYERIVEHSKEQKSPSDAQTTVLPNPDQPSLHLLKQATQGLEKLGLQAGFRSNEDLASAAAALAAEAKAGGLQRIDHVVLSTNGGANLFAVQGRLDDPAHHRICLDKTQAIAQPLEQSMQRLQQVPQLLQGEQKQQEQFAAR